MTTEGVPRYTSSLLGSRGLQVLALLLAALSCATSITALSPILTEDKFIKSGHGKVDHSDEKVTKCVCSWSLSRNDNLCGKSGKEETGGKDVAAETLSSYQHMQADQQIHKKSQDELLVSQQVQINHLKEALDKKSVQLTILEQKTSRQLKQIDSLERQVEIQEAAMRLVKDQIHGFQQKTTRDCADIQKIWTAKSGTYNISLPHAMLPVWCDLKTAGGGWTLIQRRFDGTVNFMRDWDEYRKGFGSLNGEFWLGNDHIYYLTNQARGLYRLRIDMWDFNNNYAYAEYDQFYIRGEEENYKLHTGSYNGTAGDSLTFHNGHAFSTIFHDVYNRKCPVRYEGGWWYTNSNTCHIANLNGRYHQHRFRGKNSMSWYYWKNKHISLRKVEMKVRPSYF